MATFFYNRIIQSEEQEVEGMKVLYADKLEPGNIRYVKDVVYAHRSGMDLTLQMLYPDIPAELMRFQMEEEMKRNPEMMERMRRNAPRTPPPSTGNATPGEARFMGSNPYQPKLRMPCVMFIQGSGWGKQNVYSTLPMLIDIARLGFVVASVEYRACNVEPFPGFVSDVKAAIRYLKAHSEVFGIDPTRIAIWGDSSGGHTSLMIGSTGWTNEFDEGENLEFDSSVCACVAYYGCSDFRPFLAGGKYARPFLFNHILGDEGAKDPNGWARISPITYIHEDKPYPPFLLMHGDVDATVPFEQSVFMYNKLRECHKRVDFYEVRGANHGQFFWTPEVIRITGEFLRAYV